MLPNTKRIFLCILLMFTTVGEVDLEKCYTVYMQSIEVKPKHDVIFVGLSTKVKQTKI